MKATSSTPPEEFSMKKDNERSEQGQAEFEVNHVKPSASTTTPLKIPDRFICPITLQVMRHPLTTRNGLNFERSAILSWLQRSEFCPLTRQPLRPSDLIRNRNLEIQIQYWRRMNGWSETYISSDGTAEATVGETCASAEVPIKVTSDEEEEEESDADDEEMSTRIFGFMSVTDEKEEEILQRHYHRHRHSHHHSHRHHHHHHHRRRHRTLEHRAGDDDHHDHPNNTTVVLGTERRRSILARILTSASA